MPPITSPSTAPPTTTTTLAFQPASYQPTWLARAWAELGQHERPGSADNPRIVALYRDAGHPDVTRDEVAWCAAFVGAMLTRSRLRASGSLMARSYLDWGLPLSAPRLGAVAVFTRGAAPAGHVGFVIGETADGLIVLGGNQSDAVTVTTLPRTRLLGLRWPFDAARPADPVDATDDGFPAALAHILDMEGGYTDDPLDPGGPTNRGLTLADLARHRGTPVTAATRDAMVTALRTLSEAEIATIYRRQYWEPAAGPALPRGVALFHVDTAVNMGVGTAARLLQTAVGVTVDGEIGPATLAAVRAAAPAPLLATYAELRRKRYRGLPTFARFGRGWLRRVDRTLDRALASPHTPPTEGRTTVTTVPSTATTPTVPSSPVTPKWWGRSMTIWGAIVTGLAAVAPAIGPALGVDIPAEVVTSGADQIAAIAQAAVGLLGTVMTVVGRVRAARPLARRTIQLAL
jgi:uncharacterized protein (TIGR02594 family)